MAERTNPHTEIVVGARDDASPVFDKIKGSAQGMAAGVEQSAKKAGDSVGGIGDKAQPAAGKVDGATKSIIQSIERATAAMKAGEKGTASYFEALAKQRGVSGDALTPYIAALREAEVAQKAAILGQQGMALSAKQTAAALRGVPAQITDIIVSLQGGQAPMTVLLQQGGQLKDMFGGIAPAAKALGGAVLGLVNPFTIAAAAGVGLAVAYNQGRKEAEAFNKTLILSGNAAGTSADSLSDMARAIDATSNGITQSKAAEVLNSIAASGDVAADKLQRYAQVAIEFERAGGGAADEVAKAFSSLAGDPLTAVEKLNKSTNFLTAEIYNQIKALEDEGRSTDAARVAQDAYASMLDQRIPKLKDNLGLLERGWMGVKDAAAEAWDSMLNVGRAQTIGGRLEAAQKLLADYESTLPGKRTTEQVARVAEAGGVDGLRSQIAGLKELMETQRKADEQQRANNQSTQAAINLSKQASQFDTDLEKQRKAVAQATELYTTALAAGNLSEAARAQLEKDYLKTVSGITAAKEQRATSTRKENKDLADQSRIFAELAGVSSTYYKELAAAQAQRAKGNISEAQYIAYVEELIQKQPFAVALVKEETDANKALSKSYAEAAAERIKTIQSMERAADSLQSQNDALRDEIQLIGLSATEQMEVIRLREEAVLLVKEQHLAEMARAEDLTGTMTRERIALEQEIELRRERLNLMGDKATKEQFAESNREMTREWQRTVDQYGDVFRQGFADMLNNGKDGWKSFTKSLVTTFKTTVADQIYKMFAQPFVVNIVGNLLGVAGGGAGGAAMQVASGGSGSGVLGMGSNIASIFGAGGIGGSLMAGAGWLTGATTLGGSLTAGASLLGTGTLAGGAAGLGMIAGAIAPITLAASALGNVLGLFSKTEKRGYGLMGTLGEEDGVHSLDLMRKGGSLLGGPKWFVRDTGVSEMDKALQDTYKQQRDALIDMGKALGLATAGVENFTVQLGSDELGDKKVRGIRLDGLSDEEAQKKIAEALATANNEIAQQIIGTWEVLETNLVNSLGDGWEIQNNGTARRYIESEFARDGEQAIDTLTRLATSLTGVNTVFENLGVTLYEASLAGGDMASQLVDLFGGLEQFNQATGIYMQNFYSAEEQRDAVRRQLERAFESLDLKLPDIDASDARAQFRALADAQDRTTESGRRTWAALMGLAGAFSSVTEEAGSAQSSIASVSDQLRDAFGMTADAVSGILSDAVKNAETASEAQRMAAQAFEDKFYGGALDGLTDSLGAMIQSSVIAPMMESLIAGSAASASLLASGGAVAASAMASGGAAGGAASAAGGAYAADNMASGGASAANAMVSGGSAVGSMVSAAIDSARAQINAYTQILSDPAVQAGIKDIAGLVGDVAGMTYTASRSWGGGGYSAVGVEAGGAGSEADKLAESLKKLGETMGDEVKRLRGLMVDDSAQSQAVLLARFTSSTAAARAGDIKAAEALPELSKLLETATAASAMNSIELARMRGWLAGSLEETAKIAGIELPEYAIGTNYVPRTMAAIVHEGEAIVPKAFNPWAGGAGERQDNAELIAELRALRRQNAEQAADIARLNLRVARVLEGWEAGGMPKERTERWEPVV